MRALVLLVALSGPAYAIGKVEGENASLEAVGNLRLLGAFLDYRDLPPFPGDDALLAGVGRLILKGNLPREVTYDVHAFIDVSRGPAGGVQGTFATVRSFQSPYRTPYLAWDFWQSGAVAGQLGLDRAQVQARVGRFSFTVGRFPINDSVAHLFTPNDFFAPFSATAINRLYKPGVDALRVGVSLGRLSGLELTCVMGNDPSGTPAWSETALILRANTVLKGFDFSVIGGKLAERWVVGATFQGDLGPIGVRGEGHVGFADTNGDGQLGEPSSRGGTPDRIHGRFAVGAGWRSTWHNLSLDAEYAFFSDGAAGAAEYLMRARRFLPDDLPYLAQHYVGLGFSGDFIPIVHFGAQLLVNASDGSGLGALTLLYDISDESAFVGGLLIPWGETPQVNPLMPTQVTPRSEYGLVPLTVFLESRFYF